MPNRPYIAYGSNLNKLQLKSRCPGATPLGTSVLQDYGLVFRRGFLTVEPRKGRFVPVAVWLTTPEDENSLDIYEGCPDFYVKTEFALPVLLPDGSQEEHLCYAYIMREQFPVKAPSESYINICRKGYLDFGLDVRALEKARDEALALT